MQQLFTCNKICHTVGGRPRGVQLQFPTKLFKVKPVYPFYCFLILVFTFFRMMLSRDAGIGVDFVICEEVRQRKSSSVLRCVRVLDWSSEVRVDVERKTARDEKCQGVSS